ncbi:MAG: 7-cyano-7-deazaguanine synthase QueC [Desulfobacterales bacterium]|nr:7-cyano-7-deazaguanine synthase QueC [Desulfobacterales bacterium]
MEDQPRAVVLLSGGLDSATTLAIARHQGFYCYTLSFDYGQRHYHELAASEKISRVLGGGEHHVVRLDMREIGGSALTSDMAVPPGSSDRPAEMDIPVTYVPARNTIFLSVALAWAEARRAGDIFIGVNAVDYSGYPDCRPEYLAAFEAMANLATKMSVRENQPVRINAPLLYLKKSEIIQKGMALGVDYSLTHSCYDPTPGGLACGRCDSCRLRQKGFADARVPDPTRYAADQK